MRIKVGSKWVYFKNGIATVHWVKDGMVMYSWDDSPYISSDVGVTDLIEGFLSDFKPIDCK